MRLMTKVSKLALFKPCGVPSRNSDILVSVIVPVYNTESYLRELLDSLVAQDLPANNFEIVAVNDGSTDSSGSILDEYAGRYPIVRVVHQANSGWAGKPRNVALGMSRGEYVFFADADDLLAPVALRGMIEFAQQHRLDIVMPKVVGIGGRKQASRLYSKTNSSTTPLQAVKSLTPHKLIKRSLIESNHLRFDEEPVRLEDGMFMVACYLRAKGIGILADHPLYSLRQRSDGSNISYRALLPNEYTASIAKIASIIHELSENQVLAEEMVLSLWKRKGLKIYEPRRFSRYSRLVQDQWLKAHAAFLARFISVELAVRLDDVHRRKTEAIRDNNMQAVLAINVLEAKLTKPVIATEANLVGGSLAVLARAESAEPGQIRIFARPRGKDSPVVLETVLPVITGKASVILTGIPAGSGVWDFFSQRILDGVSGPNRRMEADEGRFSSDGQLEPYRTLNGYLSLRSLPSGSSPKSELG